MALKDFWQENGFLIKTELAEAGVMETDGPRTAQYPEGGIRSLLGKYLSTNLFHRRARQVFRTRLDRTPDGKGTEIYISHRA